MSDLIQLNFDYEELDNETRIFVQSKAQAIHARLRRTAEDIVCVGNDLIAVKQRLRRENDNKRGMFESWIQSEFEMSRVAAHRFMQVAERFGDIYSNLKDISASVLYELAAPSTPEIIIEQVQSGEIPPTLDAIREAKEAQKKAEEAEQQARNKAETVQQELFQSRAESHNAIVQLSQQIEDLQKQRDERQRQISTLQQQIASVKKPEVQIKEVEKEVIPPDVQAKIAQVEAMQTQITKLTEQRNNLSKLAQDLGKDLDTLRDANEAKRQREIQEARILQNWREVTGVFHKQVLKLLTQFPTPIDTQIFEAEDWERLSQAESIASRFLAECNNLSNRTSSMVVESR